MFSSLADYSGQSDERNETLASWLLLPGGTVLCGKKFFIDEEKGGICRRCSRWESSAGYYGDDGGVRMRKDIEFEIFENDLRLLTDYDNYQSRAQEVMVGECLACQY